MLTSPKVIVPVQVGRTGAELCSSSAVSLWRFPLGNSLLLFRCRNAGPQTFRETRLRRLLLHRHGLQFLAARFGLDELAQSLSILVLPCRRIKVGRDG